MKRAFAPFGAAVLVAALAGPVAAQEAAEQGSQEEMAAMMEAVSPNENHAVLEPMIGEWEHTVTFWMAPGAPPQTMPATSTAEWIMDGRYVETEWTGEFAGMPFRGRDLTGYDNVAGHYVAVWIDNMSTAPMTSTGTYDAATKTLTLEGTSSDPMSGRTDIPTRSVITIGDEGTVHVEMYMPGPDGEMFKSMEIESRRKG